MEKKNYFPAFMKGMALGSLCLSGLCFGLYGLWGQGWLDSCGITFLTVFYHFAMRILVGTVMPNRFSPEAAWFRVRPWENRLYKKLRLRKWKSCIPTYDPSAFSLENRDPARIAENMCHAEVIHEAIVLLSFLPLVFSCWFGSFFVFFITSIVAAAIDLVFVCLQRYNRPRLLRLLKLQKTEESL